MPEGDNGGRRPSGTWTAAAARCACASARPSRSTARSRTTPPATAASTRRCWRSWCSRTRSASPRTTSPTSTGSRTRATSTRRASCSGQRRVRGRVPAAPDADRAGAGGRAGRRDDAAEVDVLLPEAAQRPAVQPALDQASPGRTSRRGARRPRSRPRPGGRPPSSPSRDAPPARRCRANIGTDVRNVTAGFCAMPGSVTARRPSSIRTIHCFGPVAGSSARTGPRLRTRSPSRARTRAPSP